jgi:hypothetical protein
VAAGTALALFRFLADRNPLLVPTEVVRWPLVNRPGLCAVHEGAFRDYRHRLAPGEWATVMPIAADRPQAMAAAARAILPVIESLAEYGRDLAERREAVLAKGMPQPDPADAASAMMRRELRDVLRALSDAERVALVLSRADDALLRAAVFAAPDYLLTLPEVVRSRLLEVGFKARHLDIPSAMSQAVAVVKTAERAARAAVGEFMSLAGSGAAAAPAGSGQHGAAVTPSVTL